MHSLVCNCQPAVCAGDIQLTVSCSTRAPGYIEVVGFIEQTSLDLQHDDLGGEEDPHGADRRGNPLGGRVYSNAFGDSIQQVVQW